MREGAVEQRLRRFLLVTSGLIFAGTIVELWFVEHTLGWVQWLPFALCGLGFCAVIIAMSAPRRRTLLLLRVVMGMVALGGFYGVFEHFDGNLAFELEIRPNSMAGEVLGDALRGANPLLAPAILALAAALAIAATYRHPALERSRAGGDKIRGRSYGPGTMRE